MLEILVLKTLFFLGVAMSQLKKITLSVSALLAFLLLSGCVSVGNNFPSQTDWLVKDETSQKDVLMLLGRPYKTGVSKGIPTWTYAYYDYKVWEKPAQKELKIYWKDDKRIKNFQFFSSFPGDVKRFAKVTAESNKAADAPAKR